MPKSVCYFVAFSLFVFASTSLADTDSERDDEKTIVAVDRKGAAPIVWKIDNIKQIGGKKPIVLGTPSKVFGALGPALMFDGGGDGLFVPIHPLQGAKQFTVELLFRPAAGGETEQRFFHLQENGSENRVLFETRLVGNGQWFLDTFIKSGDQESILYAEKFLHPLGSWYHAALVVDGKQMRHYVNGKFEMRTPLDYMSQGPGKTSIGMRINKVFWYRGDIREARFSCRVLSPDEFHLPQKLVHAP